MNILEVIGILAIVCLLPQIIRLAWFLVSTLICALVYSVIGIITGVCLLIGSIFYIPVLVFDRLDRLDRWITPPSERISRWLGNGY
jgi:hypothetical protein